MERNIWFRNYYPSALLATCDNIQWGIKLLVISHNWICTLSLYIYVTIYFSIFPSHQSISISLYLFLPLPLPLPLPLSLPRKTSSCPLLTLNSHDSHIVLLTIIVQITWSNYADINSSCVGIRPGTGPGPSVEDTEEVNMISINDFITENGIAYLDILKIDAEGNDDKVSQMDIAIMICLRESYHVFTI